MKDGPLPYVFNYFRIIYVSHPPQFAHQLANPQRGQTTAQLKTVAASRLAASPGLALQAHRLQG